MLTARDSLRQIVWMRLRWLLLLLPLACTPEQPPGPPQIAGASFASLRSDVGAQLQAAYDQWQRSHTNLAPRAAQTDAAMAFGKLALAFEQHGWASDALGWACELTPEDYRCWYLLARSELAQARFEPALNALRKARALQPTYLPVRLQLAESLLEQGALDEAVTVMGPAAAVPGPAELGLRGRIALASGDATTAVELLRHALRLDPQASRLRYPLGLALRAMGAETEALAELAQRGQRAAQIDDPLWDEVQALAGGVEVLKSRANDLALGGDYAQAATLYAQALRSEDDPLIRVNLAIALARSGEPVAAEAEYRAALAVDPEQVTGWFGLGSLLASLDRDDEAVTAYEEALALHPGELDARLNLANALYRLGRLQEAEAHYRGVIERDPARADARLALARSQIALSHWQPALQTLRNALQTHPGDARIALELARLLASAPSAQVRDGAAALRLAQHLFQRESSLPNAEVLAMALAESGRFDEAARLQQELIQTARSQQRPDLLPGLEAALASYQAGRAWRMGKDPME
jgi:tetratricopeptide (TPR) repeat protein